MFITQKHKKFKEVDLSKRGYNDEQQKAILEYEKRNWNL